MTPLKAQLTLCLVDSIATIGEERGFYRDLRSIDRELMISVPIYLRAVGIDLDDEVERIIAEYGLTESDARPIDESDDDYVLKVISGPAKLPDIAYVESLNLLERSIQ